MADHRVKRLQTVACDAQHRGIICRNGPGRNQFLGDSHGHATGRLSEDSFALREQLYALANLIVGDVICGPPVSFITFNA